MSTNKVLTTDGLKTVEEAMSTGGRRYVAVDPSHVKPLRRHRARNLTKHKKARWTEAQKLQVVTSYLMVGSLIEVSLLTTVPLPTLKSWSQQPWWKEACLRLQNEEVQQMDSRLKRVVDKALKAVENRIDEGDVQFDQKTGSLVRIPVKAHVALKISKDLMERQDKLREAPVKEEIKKTIDDRLLKLSEEFSRFAKLRSSAATAEVIEAKDVS